MKQKLLKGSILGLTFIYAHAIQASLATENELYEEYFALVNTHRMGMGLRPLTYSQSMEDVAEKHSLNMAKGLIEFGHTGFSARCQEVREALGGGKKCGEIVAWGQKTAKSVFEAWLNSPAHRGTIEGADYTHTGLGMRKSAEGRLYWTQVFTKL